MPFQRRSCYAGLFGLDALWQLLGFYLGWTGQRFRQVFGAGELKFTGQILPETKLVTYRLTHQTRYQ